VPPRCASGSRRATKSTGPSATRAGRAEAASASITAVIVVIVAVEALQEVFVYGGRLCFFALALRLGVGLLFLERGLLCRLLQLRVEVGKIVQVPG
jgi:hypothetical protein